MAIYFGNDEIKEIYHGSDKIKEVYYGSELVYTAHDPRGYWVHKDTGVITYFGLEDPSIEDGIMGYPSWMTNCSEVKLPSGVTGFKTYNWVIEEWGNWEVTYTGFVHSKETYSAGNDVLIGVDLSNTSITSIGSNSFAGCYALTSITLPIGVTSLGEYCFSQCTSLISIALPESVTSLGGGCFSWCTSLTSINIPEGVTILEGNTFQNCYALTSIALPESVTSLGGGCFSECTSLTSINIPESVTSLESECFSFCESLTSINIPEGVTSIGEYCFYECTSLILATVLPAIPPSIGEGVFDDVHTSFNIKVNSPYVNAYKTATNWNEYANKISAI